jgi:hypothetical protein
MCGCRYTVVLSAATGSLLLKVAVTSLGTANGAFFYAAPSIAHGTLYEGDTDGFLYAYTTALLTSP